MIHYYKNINALSLKVIFAIKNNNNEIHWNMCLSSIEYF